MSDLLVFIIVLGTLLLGHEFGHFAAARLSGVHVEEFGLGFPPRLRTLFTSKGTRFTLNLIPFGGFVRIAGEDNPDAEGGFASSPKRVRSFILLAGPLANVLLAILAFTAAYRFAAPDFSRVMIAGVSAASPAESAGLLPGDIILEVEGKPIDGFTSLQEAISERLDSLTALLIERGDQLIPIELMPRSSYPEGDGPIGILLGNPTMQVAWPEAFKLGWDSTWIQFREVLRLPGRLMRSEIAPEDARVSGLKGMYDMLAWAGDIDRNTQRPFLTLNMIGLISAGLALANLLPFPALDGGRLFFIGFETIFGRRISPRYEGLAHALGFIVLIGLLVYINLQDFINPISLP